MTLNNVEKERTVVTESQRPIGLCEGEFVVPDEFNEPLPESIIEEFEN